MINYIKNLFKRKYTYRKGEFTLRTKIDGTYQYYHSPTQQWLTWLVIMDDTEYMSEAELLSGTLLDMSQYTIGNVADLVESLAQDNNHHTVSFIGDNVEKVVTHTPSIDVVYDNLTIKDLREDLQQPRKDDAPVNVSSSYTPSYDSYDSSNYSSYSSSSSSSSYNSSSYDSGSCSSYSSSSSSGGCD